MDDRLKKTAEACLRGGVMLRLQRFQFGEDVTLCIEQQTNRALTDR